MKIDGKEIDTMSRDELHAAAAGERAKLEESSRNLDAIREQMGEPANWNAACRRMVKELEADEQLRETGHE
jgi:hypothetical protein